MAQKVEVLLLDDIDGKPAAETVTFGLDGVTYEIDLNAKNADALRKAYGPWIQAGRKTGRRAAGRAASNGRGSFSGVDTKAVRAWAASNGVELADRGRIPAHVIEQYRAAGN